MQYQTYSNSTSYNTYSHSSANKADTNACRHRSLKATALITLFLGTGSAFSVADIGKWSNDISERAGITISGKKTKIENEAGNDNIDTRSASQKLKAAQESLHLSVSDLSRIFGVSRQAIYKWLSDENRPTTEYNLMIDQIGELEHAVAKSNISNRHNLLKVKAFSEGSANDLLKSGSLTTDKIKSLLAKIEDSETKAKVVKSKASGIERNTDWKSSISIPSASN
ncbi:helix-turn-helix domain-containing protein [Kushneria sp. Sum13]|uniref:helix-turn-helix domain-containing protein n=1 Tax=Kushneria sp. Sum13 TaxID=3459196 RepID=UPI0040453819